MKLRLVLDVEYNPNGVDVSVLIDNLKGVVDHAMNRGMITGDTEAEVEDYDCSVAQVADTPDDLDFNRRSAADYEIETYDFGYQVVGVDGWEWNSGSDEVSKTIYFENEEDPDGPSIKGHFVVRFENGTAVVQDAYGSINGNDIGSRVNIKAPTAAPGM